MPRQRAAAGKESSNVASYPQLDERAETFVKSNHQLLIDGQWVDAASGRTFETLNPATEEVLAEVAQGEAEDVDRAVGRRARRSTTTQPGGA